MSKREDIKQLVLDYHNSTDESLKRMVSPLISDIEYLLSKLEIADIALEEFVGKHFHGGSKENRDDYVALGIPTADIFKLKQALNQILI
jgi:hypothetical protein